MNKDKDKDKNKLKLRSVGLRPTKQRLIISETLFNSKETFHFTIENLNQIIKNNFKENISLATIYNTVNAFKKKGYLKEIALEGNKTYFDTNTSNHHHFYDEDKAELFDINNDEILISNSSKLPAGKYIKSIDVMVRISNNNNSPKK